jgi:hypothetical protein
MTVSLLRAVSVWFGVLLLAILNGTIRDFFLTPHLGDTAARAISTITLCLLIALAAWFTIRWIDPASAGDALIVGVVWLTMTLAFEFLAGHYLFGKSWPELFADYDLSRGRIWIAVLIVTLLAPRWAAAARGLFGR